MQLFLYVIAFVLVLVGVAIFGKSRGVRIVARSIVLLVALASTGVTGAMLWAFVAATRSGKGDAPGALLIFAVFPAVVAWISWTMLLSPKPTDPPNA